MSNDKDKTSNDVDQLMRHKQLGAVRYREFGTPKSTTPPAAVPAAPIAAAPPAPVPTPVPSVADEQRTLRAVAAPSPLAFTFERLRRQAIATPARKPYLSLDLPERQPVQAGDKAAPQRQRLLQALFAELEAHGELRARGRA